MEDYQKRVIEEHKELKSKREKLVKFIEGNAEFGKLSADERDVMQNQMIVMRRYLMILERRIELFGKS